MSSYRDRDSAGRVGVAAGFTYVSDGLRLAGTLYGGLYADRLPLVCLPGLTRNARDFDAFAREMQTRDATRPVVALDFRGRGRSQYAAKPEDYALARETADIVEACAHLSIDRAIFVGTSRGALAIHLLAAASPGLIAGAVLNDAGPKIEAAGLRAIRDAIGRPRQFATFEDTADHLAALYATDFPALAREDFVRMAHATHVARDGAVVPDCDPQIAEALAAMDLASEPPQIWDLFERLRDVPLLVVRGETSKLLTAETLDRMKTAHPDLTAVVARGQGHAPFLEKPVLTQAIAAFCDRVEARRTPRSA